MSVKNYILRMRKEINFLKDNDPKVKSFSDELEAQSREITSIFKKIQNLDEDFSDPTERSEMLQTLNQTMEDLNKLNKLTEGEFEDYVADKKIKFREFKGKYPGLFKMFLKGNVDTDVLDHVLNTFTLWEQGGINIEQGKKKGWDKYHASKFNQK